jgi:hypothetical protein
MYAFEHYLMFCHNLLVSHDQSWFLVIFQIGGGERAGGEAGTLRNLPRAAAFCLWEWLDVDQRRLDDGL